MVAGGGNPPRRPDQAMRSLTRGGAPAPAPNVFRQIIIVGPTGDLLVYNPAVAPGNLIASISAQKTVDTQGNVVLQGITAYGNGDVSAVQINGVAVNWLTTSGSPQFNDPVGAILYEGTSGLWAFQPSEGSLGLTIQSPGLTGNAMSFLPPSGDTTGVTDLTRINALYALGIPWVQLLPGKFYVDGPVVLPPGCRLQGTVWPQIDPSLVTFLSPSATFTGTAVIELVDQATGGYSVESAEQSIIDINIDGTALGGFSSGTVDGISATGLVHTVTVERVTIYNIGGHGFHGVTNSSGNPHTWRLTHVTANTTGDAGFAPGQLTDSTWIDVQAINCGNRSFASGFFISGCTNSHFVGCRSEFSNLYGLQISGAIGSGTGSGPQVFDGFSTDRNADHGIYLDATGNVPLVFNDCQLRRDGSSLPAGAAGILIDTAQTCPVIINDLTVYPGVNDDGSGNDSPLYGVNIVATGAYVEINGAYLHAVTGLLQGTPNSNRGVCGRTGSTSAPSAVTFIADAVDQWNNVTIPATWTGSARVKLLPFANFAVFDCTITAPGGGATSGSFGALPSAAYYPQAIRTFPAGFDGVAAGVNARLNINVASTGPSFAGLPAGFTGDLQMTVIYPLD
jgi:hypothetical protein